MSSGEKLGSQPPDFVAIEVAEGIAELSRRRRRQRAQTVAAQFVQDPLVVGERVLQPAFILSAVRVPRAVFVRLCYYADTAKSGRSDRQPGPDGCDHYIEERLWLKSVIRDRRAGMS